LLVIGVIALLLFGPKRLPDAGRALGQAIRGFKGAFQGKEEPPAVAQGSESLQRSCPACAKPVEAESAFCRHCGRSLAPTPHDKAA
jgi:sec-independent protein translocase protein TatA